MKLFKSSGSHRAIIDFDTTEFEKKLNEVYQPENLKPGYADFCKHIFVENFTDTCVYYSKIDEGNSHLLK